VNLLMVSPQNQPQLLSALEISQGWYAIYRDDEAVIYRRGGGGE
jgi:hypothetical protein